jgi:hypothetical protein
MSLYTYRVRDLADHLARVLAGGATDVSEIAVNEFGEPTCTFTAPDGYVFALIGACCADAATACRRVGRSMRTVTGA